MTSKSLCFKLMKEDWKRRAWTIALTCLGLIFTILIPVAIKCSEFMEEEATWTYSVRRMMANNVVELLGANRMAVTVLLAAGVLWAISGFHYLHNSKKVDFYHSIPVKRVTLFLSVYVNGILIPGGIYLVMQLLSTALAVHANVGMNYIEMIPVKYYVINMVYYSMLYTTAVLAMMMTGNVVVALLGDLVFWGYGPMVTALVRLYYEWFHTYYETRESLMELSRFVKYSSPFSNYIFALQMMESGEMRIRDILGAVLVTVALAVLAYSLYKIRPSEAARKAMAFPGTEMPIRVLLVIPVSLAFGMLFHAIRATVFWLIFGTVMGVLLIHCIMEIIYHFDFRKLFGHRIQLGICMAVAVLLSLAGYYDWYGYDSWLPNPSKVSEAAVVIGYQDNWVTYGFPKKEMVVNPENGQEEDSYYWAYKSTDEYVFEHMKLKDIYSVVEAAKKGVLSDSMRRKEGHGAFRYDFSQDEEWERWVIRFKMNNGKVVYRNYSILMDDEMKAIRSTIHDNVEYKQGTYPILTQTASDTAMVNFQQYNKRQAVDLDYEQMTRLLNVYQREFEALTLDTRRKELPIGTIQFMTREHFEANEYEKTRKYYDRMDNRCYYPVYPSFTRTLELLKEAGVTWVELDEDAVSEVAIYYNNYDNLDYESSSWTSKEKAEGITGKEIVYDKPEDLKELVPALFFRDYYDMNGYYEADIVSYVDVTAVLAERDGSDVKKAVKGRGGAVETEAREVFYLDKNQISQEGMKKYHLDLYETIGSIQ